MPFFNASPFAQPAVKLIPGQPAYLFGTWLGDVSPTKFLVTGTQATSATVAIYNVLITEGNIPVVGSYLTVYGSTRSGGQFNITNAAVTAVSITATTGAGTITVTGSGLTTIAQGADTGVGQIPQPEIGDALANGSSIPAGLPYAVPSDSGIYQEAIQLEVNFTGLTGTSACVVTLQAAATNNPQTVWQTVIANVVTVTAGVATYNTTQLLGKWNFIRYTLTGVTAGGASIIAKVLI